jgi:hypothetical protein
VTSAASKCAETRSTLPCLDAEAVDINGGNGAARTVSAGSSGGMRSTTRWPERGGSMIERSPATPAANESVLKQTAMAAMRMKVFPPKAHMVNRVERPRHAQQRDTAVNSAQRFGIQV